MNKQCTTALTVAKALPVEVSDHSTQAIHAWHVAKTRFVALLSTQVLNSLEKLSWLQRRAFHGVVPHNRLSYQHAATPVVAVIG